MRSPPARDTLPDDGAVVAHYYRATWDSDWVPLPRGDVRARFSTVSVAPVSTSFQHASTYRPVETESEIVDGFTDADVAMGSFSSQHPTATPLSPSVNLVARRHSRRPFMNSLAWLNPFCPRWRRARHISCGRHHFARAIGDLGELFLLPSWKRRRCRPERSRPLLSPTQSRRTHSGRIGAFARAIRSTPAGRQISALHRCCAKVSAARPAVSYRCFSALRQLPGRRLAVAVDPTISTT